MTTPLVRDYMSSQLVYIREGDHTGIALKPIIEFGITAVPVVDDDHKPVGMVSLRDLLDSTRKDKRIDAPAFSVGIDASIEAAASAMADANVHHLVVVDSTGHAAGMISALDIVRALTGREAKHPASIEGFKRAPPKN
jgi:CBS domain-containing protein